MKSSLDNLIRTHSFPTTEAWRDFAAAAGVERTFFDPRGTRPVLDQPVKASVLQRADAVMAVAVIFDSSHECGVWVRPQARGLGLGKLTLRDAASRHCGTALSATVNATNPCASAMAHILRQCGFERLVETSDVTVWRQKFPTPQGNAAPM